MSDKQRIRDLKKEEQILIGQLNAARDSIWQLRYLRKTLNEQKPDISDTIRLLSRKHFKERYYGATVLGSVLCHSLETMLIACKKEVTELLEHYRKLNIELKCCKKQIAEAGRRLKRK